MDAQTTFLNELKQNLRLEVMHTIPLLLTSPNPVIHYCNSGHPGWIELFVSDELPPRLELSPGQLSWHDKYWRAGGNCYVFLKLEKSRQILVWPGNAVGELVKENGCYYKKPMMSIVMHEKGWQELYDIFVCVN